MSVIENLLGVPSISGTLYESTLYHNLGLGNTDQIFILGHADGIALNDPYQVLDIKQAVADLNSDPNSPLLRGMLECYYSGARDIWLVAVDSMSNFQVNPAERDSSYYATYYTALQITYNLLLNWDYPKWVIPMEAPFNCGADFATQLAQHCWDALLNTGAVRIGVLGTRTAGGFIASDYQSIINDTRSISMNSHDDIGRNLAVIVGEGIVSLREMPFVYSAALPTSVIGQLSTKDINQTSVNQPLISIVNLIGFQPDGPTLSALANNRFIPTSRTTVGKRGQAFQVITLTDNTFAVPNSDFWSLSQSRLVMHVTDYVRALGRRTLGTTGYTQFYTDVKNFFISLIGGGYIKNYSLDINKSPTDIYSATVDISLTPFFGLRTIIFSTTVGPGQ